MTGDKTREAKRNIAAQGVESRAAAKKRKAEINWPDAIARLRDILETNEHHHQENH